MKLRCQESSRIFADVVEDGAGDEEVAVDFGVKRSGGEADADQSEDVLEQAVDDGVVQHLRGGRGAEGGADFGVVEEGEDEALEVGVGEVGDDGAEIGVHLLGREGGDGLEVGGVDLGLGGVPHLGDGDLPLVLVAGDLPLHLDVTALGAGAVGVGEVVPHAGFERAGLIGEEESQITAVAGLLLAQLNLREDEVAGDGLVLIARCVRDVKILHGVLRIARVDRAYVAVAPPMTMKPSWMGTDLWRI